MPGGPTGGYPAAARLPRPTGSEMRHATAPAPQRSPTRYARQRASQVLRPPSGGGVHGSGATLLVQLDSALAALHPLAGRAIAAELGRETDPLRRAGRERLRAALLELRAVLERLRTGAAGAPAEVPPETLERIRTVAGHLLEAHWLARNTARRAEGIAKALDRAARQGSEIREVAAALESLGEGSIAPPVRGGI